LTLTQTLAWPIRRLADTVALQRLRRRLPNVHRGFSRSSGTLQHETDAEYLARLRILAHERFGNGRSTE